MFCTEMLRHFRLQNLVHNFLQEHLGSLVTEQNFTEGLLVKRYLNLSHRRLLVGSTLVGQTNLVSSMSHHFTS
ncbi:hypothetical protein GGP65_001059 [Salinibacter ruber]|nr:hypothetical protein [Salinibacter ruber]